MRAIELFAGAGGLALGTAMAGFRHDLVLERNKDACQTLRKNHLLGHQFARHWKIAETDVRNIDFATMEGEIDLVSDGPPPPQ